MLMTVYFPKKNGKFNYIKATIPEETIDFFEDLGFYRYQDEAEFEVKEKDDKVFYDLADEPIIEDLDDPVRKKPGPKKGTKYKKRKQTRG